MEMAGFSQNVKDRVDYLRQSHELHTELFQKLATADGGRIFGVDLVAWAVLNRSLSLIDGFSMMIESGNILCAGALLRLQLDSAMRLHACWLVEDPHALAKPLLAGEPLKSTKSKSGAPLTDRYLKDELSKTHPWVNSVYAATSGFIHLSKAHMISTVRGLEAETNRATFGLASTARAVKEDELVEALDGFIAATKCLLHLVASWLVSKDEAALTTDVGVPKDC